MGRNSVLLSHVKAAYSKASASHCPGGSISVQLQGLVSARRSNSNTANVNKDR